MDGNAEKQNEAAPPDDERESCLMCGACEILGQRCALHGSLEKD